MKRDSRSPKNFPPRDTRFKPGQSGNLKGRPKGSISFQTLIERELRKTIIITENGRHKRLTKKEVIVRRLAHDGIKGDYKAIVLMMKLGNVDTGGDIDLPDINIKIPDQSTLKIIARRLKNFIDENNHE